MKEFLGAALIGLANAAQNNAPEFITTATDSLGLYNTANMGIGLAAVISSVKAITNVDALKRQWDDADWSQEYSVSSDDFEQFCVPNKKHKSKESQEEESVEEIRIEQPVQHFEVENVEEIIEEIQVEEIRAQQEKDEFFLNDHLSFEHAELEYYFGLQANTEQAQPTACHIPTQNQRNDQDMAVENPVRTVTPTFCGTRRAEKEKREATRKENRDRQLHGGVYGHGNYYRNMTVSRKF